MFIYINRSGLTKFTDSYRGLAIWEAWAYRKYLQGYVGSGFEDGSPFYKETSKEFLKLIRRKYENKDR